MSALDPGRDRPRVRPRVVRDAFVARLKAAVQGETVPELPSGVPGLAVVLVLDSQNSVAYLTAAQLAELGLTPVEALALARNLASTRDTLVLTGLPANGDWSSLRKLARAASGEPLWPDPLLVCPTGIVAVASPGA